jgi:hypothetical protein
MDRAGSFVAAALLVLAFAPGARAAKGFKLVRQGEKLLSVILMEGSHVLLKTRAYASKGEAEGVRKALAEAACRAERYKVVDRDGLLLLVLSAGKHKASSGILESEKAAQKAAERARQAAGCK